MSCDLCEQRDERVIPATQLVSFKLKENGKLHDRKCCKECLVFFFDHLVNNEYVLNDVGGAIVQSLLDDDEVLTELYVEDILKAVQLDKTVKDILKGYNSLEEYFKDDDIY